MRAAAGTANGMPLTSFYGLSTYTTRASSIGTSSPTTSALEEKEAI
jgi:hypothetical protein